jgi:hypothetical protein
MTKKRISPVQTPEPIKVKPTTPAGDLAAPEAITSAIDQVTEPQKRKSDGRPIKPTSAGRVPYSTMIRGEYLKKLKKRAIDEDLSTADLLERIISRYLSEWE